MHLSRSVVVKMRGLGRMKRGHSEDWPWEMVFMEQCNNIVPVFEILVYQRLKGFPYCQSKSL
ncbi:hypothetical protein OESDEN_11600 [Oesophagostomum dentatum]|uniref:Uncharacterized protein n=1 Tax=Oesophagostomum dentatum TaxID=61180 RepID=A0A0B1SUI6_OESDE|nr:hypothetical protein OESDEN_11600 [Oesophagostomum dentatum]